MPSRLNRTVVQPYRRTTQNEYVSRNFISWLLPSSLLFVYRLAVAVYAFAVLFTTIGILTTTSNTEAAQRSFSYFTVLGYWGLACYYVVAAAHTASYAFRSKAQAWLQSWPSGLKWLHSAFYATITVFPFIITTVFWAVLAGGAFTSTFSTWSNTSEHALNSVFAFAEIMLPCSEPHPWLNVLPLIVVLACYLGLAYLTHATQGFYVYPFLDPANGQGLVAGACIGILVGTILVFAIVKYLIKLRLWITETKTGVAISRSIHEKAESDQGDPSLRTQASEMVVETKCRT